MAPPSLLVAVPSGAGCWTTAAAASGSTSAPNAAAPIVEPAAAPAESMWLGLFEGAVPHAAVYLGVPEHLALAASCRALYHAWPRVAGLKTLAIFLDRSALPSSAAIPVETPVAAAAAAGKTPGVTAVAAASPNENRNPNHQPLPPYMAGHHHHQQQHRPWNSLSRLLRHWAPFVETLRFAGTVAGPVEDCLKEALGPALATPIILPPSPEPGGKRALPTPALPRLKTLALPRIGLYPYLATSLAAFLVGPGGARLEVLDLSHNSALRDEGAVAIFRTMALAAEKAAAAEARAQAAANANASVNGRGRVVRRRRASSEPTHRLPALRRLVLSSTQLTAVGLHAVFQALRAGAMPNLEALVLADNPLKIPGGEVLAAMIEAGVLPRLQLLDATACGLGPAETRRLAEAMAAASGGGGLGALRSLAAGSNYVDSQGAAALAQAIRAGQLPRLSQLRMDLSGDAPAALLLEALGANGGLRALDLGKNTSLTGETWRRALLPTGAGVPLAGLEELSLFGCKQLQHHGPAALVRWAERFGSSAAPALRVLNLRGIGLDCGPEAEEGVPPFEDARPHLMRLLGCFPRLESLNLGMNGIDGDGVACLCKEAVALGPRCRLRVLDLSFTGLRKDGLRALSDALAQGAFPSLRELVLSRITFLFDPDAEWEHLLQVLAKRAEGGQGLEVLDLSHNNLGGVGALFAGSVTPAWRTLLCSPNGLRSLNLEGTGLTERFGSVLVEMLEPTLQDGDAMDVDGVGNVLSSRLATLNLSYSGIGQTAICRLLRAVVSPDPRRQVLSRLQTLSLVRADAGDAVVVEMAKLVAQESCSWLTHSRLQLVDLRGTEATREARVQLQGQLTRLRNRLLQEGLCGYTRRLQGLVRVGPT